jgi:hypothetical protein
MEIGTMSVEPGVMKIIHRVALIFIRFLFR